MHKVRENAQSAAGAPRAEARAVDKTGRGARVIWELSGVGMMIGAGDSVGVKDIL